MFAPEPLLTDSVIGLVKKSALQHSSETLTCLTGINCRKLCGTLRKALD